MKRSRLTVLLTLVAALGIGGIAVWGFLQGRSEAAREALREHPSRKLPRVAIEQGQPVIVLDPLSQKESGIETALPPPVPYQQQIRAYARVLDLTRLTELANGYADAQAQLQAAQARLASSEKAVERSRLLYKDRQNVSLAQLQASEATFRVDQAALAAAQSRTRTLAATVKLEWGPVLAKSLVEGSELLNRLMNGQAILLQVTLPPGVVLSSPPLKATIETGKNTLAPILFVSSAPRTDPKIQGVSFFYTASTESNLPAGMNVLAFLPSGPQATGVKIPDSAIVWWQDRAWVYRRIRTNTFARMEIPTDRPTSDGGFVIKSVPAEMEIVTHGAQLLLSEEFRAQIQMGEEDE
ncbi:MAG: multidrug transporter [Acidobacteriia bacterium]|nr:efflux RND transporter periplasmic adaptor subunit [Methyloceanibacter sp.]MCL6491606.1 multidrug transporter [Terriglobia bacterium]